ncbi:MAG TPA: tripartite tricarboxylate transporter permease, partial [Burkholderiaceae bacterium]|nr:tripartite tricarboxylate transporter permease [Burkholderiaceae bacterium]
MDELGALLHGFGVALSWYNVGMMAVGIVLGIIIGVLPGLGGPNGVAILLPLTFTMQPTSAIIMLSCIYWGTLFAGAITSVLFNIPGETHSVATTFDGYPMAQQGRAGEALTASFTGSFIGAFLAVLLITFLAPLVAKFALRFGPPEFFAVYLLTFCSFVGTGKDPAKTIISMMIGFGLAAIGMDTVSGELRMTFGWSELLRGVDFLVVVIGLFGLGEILSTPSHQVTGDVTRPRLRDLWPNREEWRRSVMPIARGSVLGFLIGIIPGSAHIISSFLSYAVERRVSRH